MMMDDDWIYEIVVVKKSGGVESGGQGERNKQWAAEEDHEGILLQVS